MVGFLAMLVAVPFPFINNGWVAFSVVWFVLFFGGIILPIMTGVMLLTVDDELRPEANAFANLCYNLIGYLPAPGLYGLLDKLSGSKKPRWGAAMVMWMIVMTFFTLVIANRTLGDKLSRGEQESEKGDDDQDENLLGEILDDRRSRNSLHKDYNSSDGKISRQNSLPGLEPSAFGLGITESLNQNDVKSIGGVRSGQRPSLRSPRPSSIGRDAGSTSFFAAGDLKDNSDEDLRVAGSRRNRFDSEIIRSSQD